MPPFEHTSGPPFSLIRSPCFSLDATNYEYGVVEKNCKGRNVGRYKVQDMRIKKLEYTHTHTHTHTFEEHKFRYGFKDVAFVMRQPPRKTFSFLPKRVIKVNFVRERMNRTVMDRVHQQRDRVGRIAQEIRK